LKLFDTLLGRHASRSAREQAAGSRAPSRCDGETSDGWDALCREGERLLAAGAPDAALKAFQGAIDAADACVEGHVGQARAYHALGCAADAIDSLEVALALDPRCVPALRLLAGLRRDRGEEGAALELLQQAAQIAPTRSEVLLELGVLLNRCGRTDAAIETYAQAIRTNPRDPGAHVNLGLIHLQQLGDAQAAEAEFRTALALSPDHVGAAANLGLALHDQGRYAEALSCYRKGEEDHPDCVEFRWNRAVTELATGDYRNGWEGYALRFARAGGRNVERFAFPDWRGERIVTGKLLVLAEQGLGDEIMFASCLPDLATLVDDGVVLECSPRLAALFERSFPDVAIHGADRHASLEWLSRYPEIVAKVPIGSLPRYLRSEVGQFVSHAGYLRADPTRTQRFCERLQRLANGAYTVGLSWRAGTRATRGALRSLDLDLLQPLCDLPNIRPVCLQHGLGQAELVRARAMSMLTLDDIGADFEDVAALIAALDCVVSAANTNAHLAAALGRPTRILLNSASEWRWRRDTPTTPWYPQAELLRAPYPDHWEPAVAEAAARIGASAAAPRPQTTQFDRRGAA